MMIFADKKSPFLLDTELTKKNLIGMEPLVSMRIFYVHYGVPFYNQKAKQRFRTYSVSIGQNLKGCALLSLTRQDLLDIHI